MTLHTRKRERLFDLEAPLPDGGYVAKRRLTPQGPCREICFKVLRKGPIEFCLFLRWSIWRLVFSWH